MITALRRRSGSSVSALCRRTGWLPHSVRAAISGLRRDGHKIEPRRSASDGRSIYRIAKAVQTP